MIKRKMYLNIEGCVEKQHDLKCFSIKYRLWVFSNTMADLNRQAIRFIILHKKTTGFYPEWIKPVVYKDYYGFKDCIKFPGSITHNHCIERMELPNVIIERTTASTARNKGPVVKGYA